ncbi:hypothetical protein PT974_11221 [Cladobotryum mycophilum]|uniref:ORP1 like protein n=1 Tax=Cladobotryum mycophilum TaxID=491253 RepID=A0ABR0S4P9_9HYPO
MVAHQTELRMETTIFGSSQYGKSTTLHICDVAPRNTALTLFGEYRYRQFRTTHTERHSVHTRGAPNSGRHRSSYSISNISSHLPSGSGFRSKLPSATATVGRISPHNLSTRDLAFPELKIPKYHESSSMSGLGEGQRPSPSLLEDSAATEAGLSAHGGTLPENVLRRSLTSVTTESSPLERSNQSALSFQKPRIHKRATSAPDPTTPSSVPGRLMLHTTTPQDPENTAYSLKQQAATPVAATMEPGSDSCLSSLTPEPGSRILTQSPIMAGHSPVAVQTAQSECQVTSPQAEASDTQWEEPCCMFVKDCNTGSQLRKAISHLFGRNKSCTLRIPKKVWVYYCRKHYQRVRYRNAKTYPLNQMELVQMQLRRLQAWSGENQRSGNGPYIKIWTLSLRKREQNRLHQSTDTADEGDNHQSGSVAPEWLIQHLGGGYTTEQMMEVADRLHDEIKNGSLSQVPEIEFLPDITDFDDGGSAKPVRSRKQSRQPNEYRPPKRKASELSESRASVHATSPYWRDEEDEVVNPPEKRARIDHQQVYHRHRSVTLPAVSSSIYAYDGRLTPSTAVATENFRMPPMLPRVQPFDYTQSTNASTYSHAGSFTNAYDQGQQTSAYRQPGVEYVQSSFRWSNGHDGHIRLPSISAHLPAEESNFNAASQGRSFYRGFGAYTDGQGHSRHMHQHSVASFAPMGRSDHSSTRSSSSGVDNQAGVSHYETKATATSGYEFETPGVSREAWPQQDYIYAPGWGRGYRHAVPQQQHFQPAPTHQQHPRHALDTWRTPMTPVAGRTPFPPEMADHSSHSSTGWQQDTQPTGKLEGSHDDN